MATVTNTVKLPDGSTPNRVDVVIELVASTSGRAAGWVTATDVTVLSTARPTVTAGAWTASLTPNADITPSGTVYKVTEVADRHSYVHYIEVGSGGGSLHDLLVDPPATVASAALAVHEAEGVHSASYYLVDFGDVDTTGAVASDVAMAAAITAMQAAGGGTLIFPAGTIRLDDQIDYPNDGQANPKQKAVRWVGQASWFSGKSVASAPTGGTILDMRYSGSEACLLTRGEGVMEITGITFTQLGTAHTTPFIKTTNTTLLLHHCAFVGHSTKSATTADQDAIIIGGTETSFGGGEPDDPFQGYGTVIESNYFNRIRRGLYLRVYANAIVIRDNTWWAQCGGGAGSSAIEVDSGNGIDYSVGGVLEGNLVECVGYETAFKLNYVTGWTILGNNFYDSSGIDEGFITLTNSIHNIIIAGHYDGAPLFAGTPAATNLVIEPNGGQIKMTGTGATVGPRLDPRIGIGAAPSTNRVLELGQTAAGDSLLHAVLLASPTGYVLDIRDSANSPIYQFKESGASLQLFNVVASPADDALRVKADNESVPFSVYTSDTFASLRVGHTSFTGEAQNRVRGSACGYYFDTSDGTQAWLIYRTNGATQGSLFFRDVVNARMLLTMVPGASSTASRAEWLAIQRHNAAALWQTTVGAAGAASALPATPTKYLKVQDDTGTTYVIPAYAAS
jgi:hypothetical protein